jgi:hypothetical protein
MRFDHDISSRLFLRKGIALISLRKINLVLIRSGSRDDAQPLQIYLYDEDDQTVAFLQRMMGDAFTHLRPSVTARLC